MENRLRKDDAELAECRQTFQKTSTNKGKQLEILRTELHQLKETPSSKQHKCEVGLTQDRLNNELEMG